MAKLSIVTVSTIALATVLAVIAALLAPAANAQETDPAAIFDEFVDAINGGDVDAALALFTEDATWTRGGRCPPGTCAGTDAIRGELEKDVDDHHRIDVVDVEVSGSTLTARTELRTDGTREEGIERVIQTVTLEFDEDKISSLLIVPDLTDPMTAEIRARRLPTSGSGPSSSAGSTLPLVAGLLLAGMLLLAGARQIRTPARNL